MFSRVCVRSSSKGGSLPKFSQEKKVFSASELNITSQKPTLQWWLSKYMEKYSGPKREAQEAIVLNSYLYGSYIWSKNQLFKTYLMLENMEDYLQLTPCIPERIWPQMFAWLLRKPLVHDEKMQWFVYFCYSGWGFAAFWLVCFLWDFFGMVVEDSSRIILLFQWFQKGLWLKHKAWYILPATPYHFSWQLSQCLGVRLSFSLCLLGKPLKMISPPQLNHIRALPMLVYLGFVPVSSLLLPSCSGHFY